MLPELQHCLTEAHLQVGWKLGELYVLCYFWLKRLHSINHMGMGLMGRVHVFFARQLIRFLIVDDGVLPPSAHNN